jgi:hypothetical protein
MASLLNYMIELTTGVMFLMSSVYGAGSIPSNTANIVPQDASSTDIKSSVTISSDRNVVIEYLQKNFADTPILVEIAKCESEFRQFNKNGDLLRGRVDNADVGVMQINERYHLEDSKKLGFNIHTIEGNVAYAKYLYEKSGSKPWSASQPCWGKTVVAMNTK